jgi:ParB family chromosome partitioning protein
MAKKQRLGRGLASLIPDVDLAASGKREGKQGSTQTVPITSIAPNPYQPRASFDDDSLSSLADSIRDHGVLQPLVVRRSNEGYELVAGERRLRAAKLAGLDEVPVVVREKVSKRAMLALALVENLQRENLHALEEATGYRTLVELGLTQSEVADRVGRDRTTVTNALRLLSLPPEVQEMLADGRLSAGHGRAVLMVSGRRRQISLAKKIAERGLSVRQAERLATGSNTLSTKLPTSSIRSKDPLILLAERGLRERLGTPVQITYSHKGGTVAIKYANDDELTRILDLLGINV